ncbi:MAG: hypothetical protein WCJ57_01695 [Candidatus Falkowbacteria bacterium]
MEYQEITMGQTIFFLISLTIGILSYGFYCLKKEKKLKTAKSIKNIKMGDEPHSDENLSLQVA